MILPPVFRPVLDPQADPDSGGVWFVFHSGRLLVRLDGDRTSLPTLSAGVRLPVSAGAPVLLGMTGAQCYWGAVALTEEAPTGWAYEPLRGLFNRLPDDLLAIAGRAAQLLDFDRTHRFCGVCATPMQSHEDGRSRQCPNCGQTVYPRIAPAMMALIKRDGPRGRELLLARNARFPTAMYSALAGFVEPSESVEDCIHREVREEVGVSVRGLRYFGSQSWPFPHSLMIAFVVDYEAGEIVCEDGEIADARWFGLDGLPLLPHRLSIARRLINATIAEVEPGHPILNV
jgi:NAD+ diphosphatase